MATKITNDVLESHLHCKFKGHLKLAAQRGTKGDFEAMLTELRAEVRLKAIEAIIARHPDDQVARNIPLTVAAMKRGPQYLLDATLEDDSMAILFDGLKQADGPSRLGEHYYLPVLHHHGDKVGRRQKLLLAVLGLVLDRVQGRRPAFGLVARGPEGRLGKVRLDARFYRQAEHVLDEVKRLQAGGEPPKLTLNKHCHVCEFRQRCREQAEKADDISLLGGVGEKELKRYSRKGIFTLTQLSCTFRPRKRGKRVKKAGYIRYAALQALAVREKKVHVYGMPDVPRKSVQVFFDAEGSEDGGFAYLLGVLVVEGDGQEMHSFWADGPGQEVQIFDAFLDLLDGREDFCLFHYGSYERKLLKRMRKVVNRKGLVDRALDKSVNVLSAIHASVYFPTYSNGLKEIGKYLGCIWTAEDASGLQSLVWRARWDQGREVGWKEKLVTYNAEDCAALRKVTEFVQGVGEAARNRSEGAPAPPSSSFVAWVDEIATSRRRTWCRPEFVLQDFDQVHRCAFFDYQREKIFLRTSEAIRKACQNLRKQKKAPRLPVNSEVEVESGTCPYCKSNRIGRFSRETHSKLAYDLKFTKGGIRRQVIRYSTVRYLCRDCERSFLPEQYKRRDKHLHGLKSWAMYQHVVHRISFNHLETMFEDCFGLRVGPWEAHMLKALMANRYRETVKRILARIVASGLALIDETEVRLKKDKGYVWVLTNLEDVVYLYRPNREADFLKELLCEFKGVLVTDFYGGYDSLSCPQQKCLIHLIRDFNNDLMGNPYDEEFKALAGEFGKLLRSIVDTIDKYGLKKHHLHKHKAEVDHHFRALESRVYRSELADSYQKRLLKNEGRLFTFLDYNGVPWNNNPAEHAIHAFAYFREVSDGQLREEGLSDYLVLLSVYQTCKYRGVSFLKFLLSREEDVEVYCQQGREKKEQPGLEIYPEGFAPSGRRIKGPHGDTKDEGQ
jgi:predicted RecB family nuclease